jgi:hypothetical protein
MLIFNYESKKQLRENIGNRLNYTETSIFGDEYVSTGKLVGCNRPHLTGFKREFFAEVTLKDDIIMGVK